MRMLEIGVTVIDTHGRIRRIFENCDVDVIFLMNTDIQDSNFTYLTEFTSGVFEQTMLIVTKNEAILPVSSLEYEIAREQHPKNIKVVKFDSGKRLISIMKRYMHAKRVGINGSFLTYRHYMAIKKYAKPKKVIDIADAFRAARSIKDNGEISKIKIANRIAKRALETVKRKLKEGVTEKEVAAMIEYNMIKHGASGASFDSIISFNENAALPHHMPGNSKLKRNSIVLMDIGARYNNYCSDITRTFMFKPDFKSSRYKRFTEIYKIVGEAQKMSIGLIKEGAKSKDVHEAAARFIDKAKGGKYKGKFIHSLGHAIGIEVHDAGPGLNLDPKGILKENMVVSDEPGIYVVGFGGVRIEDDVIVTKKGSIVI